MATVLEKKKCKECGEYFTPRSMRQQYCDKLHYRPCPVCGKPVEAKYLSDPARCCSQECKNALRAKAQKTQKDDVVTMVENQMDAEIGVRASKKSSSEWIAGALFDKVSYDLTKVNLAKHEDKLKKKFDVKTYAGPKVLGMIPGHDYAVKLTRPKGYTTYEMNVLYDFDTSKVVEAMVPLSSMIMVNRWFI